MAVLNKSDRTQLKNSVLAAREIAEEAAKRAVNVFAVSEATPPDYLTQEQKEYRQKLRAHGRELGDKRSDNRKQSITHLVEKIAYEEWHKMLFARFLAENNLLMYPDGSVNVSLNDCEDLAKDEGYENKWECAAAFASKMLPMIFKKDSLTANIKFSTADRQKLEEIIETINADVFHATDALGWCYQFWQEKRKSDINNSEIKIGEDEISPVTQLFTEPYMVSFLLDNALGAWYANKILTSDDLCNAKSEEELREKVSLPEMPLEYLRFVFDEDNSKWKIAGNTLDDWPKNLSELKVLDPCCGSGHFLVAVFRMLVAIRQKLEGTDVDTTIQNVLRENINGLELDGRCVELAVFALAFAAWTYPDSKGFCKLPKLNIACCGKAIRISKTEWENIVNEHTKDKTERVTLDLLYNAFKNAPTLGSLIDPKEIIEDMKIFGADWDSIKKIFIEIVQSTDQDEKEMGLSALGVIETAELLANEYHWIITNPPYLHIKKANQVLYDYSKSNFPNSCSNLATSMLERCLKMSSKIKGVISFVTPQNWLMLGEYKNFRKQLLTEQSLNCIAQLGSNAFQTPMFDFKIILIQLRNKNIENNKYFYSECLENEIEDKTCELKNNEINFSQQQKQLNNPDYRIVTSNICFDYLMSNDAKCVVGLQTGDDSRYIFEMAEITSFSPTWEFFQNTPDDCKNAKLCDGFSQLLRWEQEKGELTHTRLSRPYQGREAFGKKCFALIRMGHIKPIAYSSSFFHQNLAVMIPLDEKEREALWCYCESKEYEDNIRSIDNKLNVTNATLVKVPFDKERWRKVAEEKYPNGLPQPFTNDPSQWIFHGHPCKSVIWNEETKKTCEYDLRIDDNVMQVAVARMLGYKWPAENDKTMELAPEQRAIVDSVTEEFKDYVDDDGIVCIPALNREKAAGERLISLLSKAYGDRWNQNILNELLKISGFEGKTIESYLRDGFFKEHCKLFNNRPFIWHIWDGLNDGFSVLVNYHKLDNKLLTKLIYTVLGDWIQKQKTDYQAGIDGSERKLEAAQALQKKLIAILEGESPVDIFVRWKKLEEQAIGWNPDLNDGVRMNIRPFVLVGDVKVRGAGVLRDKFNINWNKDRGKDVETSPWYKEFKGERINDYHLTLQQKKDIRK